MTKLRSSYSFGVVTVALFIASKFYTVFPILSFIVISTGMTTVDNGPDFHHYSLSKVKVDLAGGGILISRGKGLHSKYNFGLFFKTIFQKTRVVLLRQY